MSAIRPLPARPSLEFERKEAKALLRQLRAGDPDAMRRAVVRHPSMQTSSPQLADAQLVIAREYGFSSWPRLVRYFEDAQRILNRTPSTSNPGLHPASSYPKQVSRFIEQHRRNVDSAARALIAYVPRFYGLSIAETFELAPTEDEARLAVARQRGFVSWDALIARINFQAADSMRSDGLEIAPLRQAIDAMNDADLEQLRTVVAAHPELLTPGEHEQATGAHLLSMALEIERNVLLKSGDTKRLQPIMRWLASMGFDLQRQLNIKLCGHREMTTDEVQHWIDRGANPNWIAPNGFSVLEHAIVRYFSASALDRLAQYAAAPAPALWIAAGLGDVAGVQSFLDDHGKPTAAARALRPQFDALGPNALPLLPFDDDDEILMEAAMVAYMNGRTAVMEFLIARGFPVNTLRWDMPFVVMSVGNGEVKMVETLVRCGADLDLRGAYNGSAREMARDMLVSQPPDNDRRRIAELCGLDVEAILAAHDASPPSTPSPAPQLTRLLMIADDDARRMGHSVITTEHLTFGLLRAGFARAVVEKSGMDRERFREDAGDRVQHGDQLVGGESLPVDADTQAMIDAAFALAAAQRRDHVYPHHLLHVLVHSDNSVVARTIVHYGGDLAKARDFVSSMS